MSGFPMYQIDFGYGVPIKIRSIKLAGTAFDGVVFVLAGGPNGTKEDGVDFIIELKTEAMERMLKDDEFRRFAKL